MSDHRQLVVRPAAPGDELLLLHVIALAADWRPGTTARSVDEVLAAPELAHYAPDWQRGLDRGLVAEVEGRPVGAAWWRFFPPDDPGYGFVAADIPEVTVAVEPEHRGRGIGSCLLRDLVALARDEGLPGLSLSVEPDNRAVELYQHLGFVPVGSSGGARTMLLALDRPD